LLGEDAGFCRADSPRRALRSVAPRKRAPAGAQFKHALIVTHYFSAVANELLQQHKTTRSGIHAIFEKKPVRSFGCGSLLLRSRAPRQPYRYTVR